MFTVAIGRPRWMTCIAASSMTRFGWSLFNTREGWSKDVSREFAGELQRRSDLEGRELVGSLATFVEDHTRAARQLTLRLA